ncbi:MAG: hypothetical protein PUD77_09020 [Clostridiales bacterium]|nr:hypothetical protein [Clostridiales bacterium]
MSRMLPIFVDGLPGIAYTLIAYSKALKCKVRLVIWIMLEIRVILVINNF